MKSERGSGARAARSNLKDNLEDIIQNINDNLVPIYGSGAPTNSAVYEGQIYIDNATGEIYIATNTAVQGIEWFINAFANIHLLALKGNFVMSFFHLRFIPLKRLNFFQSFESLGAKLLSRAILLSPRNEV